jgi:hypothetical protein
MTEPVKKPDSKKLDTKRIRKHTSFLQLNLCHYALNFYITSLDLGNINYPIFIEMLNNFIYNIFSLSLANNITLDKTKILIDDGCLLISDYVIICHEEEFKKNTFNLRIADAIQYGYAKISDKIIASIPVITKHTNFIDALDSNLAANQQLDNGTVYNTKPSSLPKSLPSNLTNSIGANIDKRNLIKNKFGDISQQAYNRLVSIKGINTRCNRIIYLISGFITHIFNTVLRIGFFSLKTSAQKTDWFKHMSPIHVADGMSDGSTLTEIGSDREPLFETRDFSDKITYNLDILESYLNLIYPILYTIVKHNEYMNLAEYLNDITCIIGKCVNGNASGSVLIGLYIYLRELCQISHNIDRLIMAKVINDINLFIITDNPCTMLSINNTLHGSPYLYSKTNITDGITFDNIYKKFNKLD